MQASSRPDPSPEPARPWALLSNHALVLVCIATIPAVRMREIAPRVGVTERTVHRLIADLETSGYIRHARDSRRDVHEIASTIPHRHPFERGLMLANLIAPECPPAGG